MSNFARTTEYDGKLFRVEHQPVDGRELPYEFARRIGAVTVMPIEMRPPPDGNCVLAIQNTRRYYGSSLGLPGGNRDGGFERPEPVGLTALRELKEETGYGYELLGDVDMDIFRLREASKTVRYDRSFAVARRVTHIGGEVNDPAEQIELQLVPLDEYVEPLLALQRGELYPEVNAAFAKSRMELGRDAVLGWLKEGRQHPDANAVIASFEPWLLHEPVS